MMKSVKLLSLASAVLLLAACADENVPTVQEKRDAAPENNAIAFSTYMGKSGTTRAGYEGSINTEKLQTNTEGTTVGTDGFGVFAYYTGTYTYGQYQNGIYADTEGPSTAQTMVANFMFNQQVKWDNSLEGYITKWSYSPIKYWPNEVNNGGTTADWIVDDQDNDAANAPATADQHKENDTDTRYGGNVSFFAYAPYVGFNTTSGSEALKDGNSTVDAVHGITAINGQTTLTGANAVAGDPKITYVINPDASKTVDLLWGTTSSNGPGVTGYANAGVTSTAALGGTAPNTYIVPNTVGTASQKVEYSAEILRSDKETTAGGYTVNADLTKQKTGGTVGFAFKHALSKLGGSNKTETTTGGGTKNSGLLIVLDLDDQKGGETGGTIELDDNNKALTKVTVDSIKIQAAALVEAPTADGTETKYTWLAGENGQSGVFNLATGKWDIDTSTSGTTATATTSNSDPAPAEWPTTNGPAITTYKIYPSGVTGTGVSATMNPLIAETSYSSSNTNGFKEQPDGVKTTVQNVYGEEANPLLFIPGTYPDLKVTIAYNVRTLDGNLKDSASLVKQVITKRLVFKEPLQLNKQYSLVLHLGLTSVKFTAYVSDWDVVGEVTETTSGETVTVTENEVEKVYLPINVAQYRITQGTISEVEATNGSVTITTTGDNAMLTLQKIKAATSENYYTGTNNDDWEATLETVTWSFESLDKTIATFGTETGTENVLTFTDNTTNATRTVPVNVKATVGGTVVCEKTILVTQAAASGSGD